MTSIEDTQELVDESLFGVEEDADQFESHLPQKSAVSFEASKQIHAAAQDFFAEYGLSIEEGLRLVMRMTATRSSPEFIDALREEALEFSKNKAKDEARYRRTIAKLRKKLSARSYALCLRYPRESVIAAAQALDLLESIDPSGKQARIHETAQFKKDFKRAKKALGGEFVQEFSELSDAVCSRTLSRDQIDRGDFLFIEDAEEACACGLAVVFKRKGSEVVFIRAALRSDIFEMI